MRNEDELDRRPSAKPVVLFQIVIGKLSNGSISPVPVARLVVTNLVRENACRPVAGAAGAG